MIEAIAITLEDAVRIEIAGAERIELVSALSEGGLTPSYELIKLVCDTVKIPVNVMIRPHSNSFFYTNEEINLMKSDIEIAKSLGANGVVFGALDKNNHICTVTLEKLLESCEGLDITFHRAIDELQDLVKGVEILSKYPKITSILTSGGKGSIENNLDIINRMSECSEHINILVGGGLTLENIKNISSKVSTDNFHFGTAIRTNKSINMEIDVSNLKYLINEIKNHTLLK